MIRSVTTRETCCSKRSPGGDEFMVLAKVASPEDAKLVAENIFKSLQEDVIVEHHNLHVTASIGIALYPQDGTDIATLIKNADMALYRVKESGRKNYQLYSRDMHTEARERMQLENELRGAVERRELELYYQPIVDVRSGRIMGAEALVRWHHPTRGFLAPSQFIPLAEETGAIFPIGDWVFDAACSQLRQWHDAGFPGLTLGVNFSPQQLMRRNLIAKIGAVLTTAGLPPGSVALELTENIAIRGIKPALAMLKELRALGLGLVLDDFGMGHSSLGYLKQFAITGLKIDQTFVRRSLTDREDAAVIKAIILLATTLELGLVAEGIETEAEKQFLLDAGCHLMQGYLFSPPVPAGEFEKLLTSPVTPHTLKYSPKKFD